MRFKKIYFVLIKPYKNSILIVFKFEFVVETVIAKERKFNNEFVVLIYEKTATITCNFKNNPTLIYGCEHFENSGEAQYKSHLGFNFCKGLTTQY